MTWLKVTHAAVLGTTFEKIREERYGGAYGSSHSPAKWRCTVCGREGCGGNDSVGRAGWTEACRRGHSPCDYCGKMLPLLLHGGARRHTRCKERGGA